MAHTHEPSPGQTHEAAYCMNLSDHITEWKGKREQKYLPRRMKNGPFFLTGVLGALAKAPPGELVPREET